MPGRTPSDYTMSHTACLRRRHHLVQEYPTHRVLINPSSEVAETAYAGAEPDREPFFSD
jgi:hypothetical protein